ncbi:hypothetical protein SR41_16650 [Sphingomonas melonis]|uniref:Uncharacterized protein n=1 Tax=Sphingomonas melonis TaxID=152682 RepID=A0A0D1KNP1_9SPHN|nr:hypothetical protein SR41_16650 [Sphingomonas melonis]
MRKHGFDARAISAAWPRWWTDAAETSASARNELRFAISRALGLDPRALVEGDQVRPTVEAGVRFKGLGARDAEERAALVSFGQSVARLLVAAASDEAATRALPAERLRRFLLGHGVVPDFQALVAICWKLRLPVVYLEVTPLRRKAMHAMAAGGRAREAILIAQHDKLYARAAFTLAHEIGHVMLGHVGEHGGPLDIDDPLSGGEKDAEEVAADRYALELLTGRPEPLITTTRDDYTAADLAQAASRAGAEEGIDPAVIAMCDGFRTSDWRRSTAACKILQPKPAETWREANDYAQRSLDWSALPPDGEDYLRRVLGLPDG